MVNLVDNAYGKQQIHASYVDREVEPHGYHRVSVDTSVAGKFDRAYVEGRNEDVLPTDTMRAAVLDLLGREGFTSAEQLGLAVADYLITAIPAAAETEVTVRNERWTPIAGENGAYVDAFVGEPGQWCATIHATSQQRVVWGGIEGVPLAKTARSAFREFLRDEITVLDDEDDRVVGSTLNATWRYGGTAVDFASVSEAVRRRLLRAFAAHTSESLQHTIYAMGSEALAERAEIDRIRLQMPNYHHVRHDGGDPDAAADGQRLVFRVDQTPYGHIEGELARPTA